jgi:hypothetical protein
VGISYIHFLGLGSDGLHLGLISGLELALHVEGNGSEVAGRHHGRGDNLVEEGSLLRDR